MYLLSSSQDSTIVISGQSAACQFSFNTKLNPSQSYANECKASSNDWVIFTGTSTRSVNLSISFLGNGGTTDSLPPAIIQTGSQFSIDVPVFSNCTVLATLQNGQVMINQITGRLTIYAQTASNVTTATIIHPYRVIGSIALGVAGFGLFVLVWNPKSVVQSLSSRIKSKFLRKSIKSSSVQS